MSEGHTYIKLWRKFSFHLDHFINDPVILLYRVIYVTDTILLRQLPIIMTKTHVNLNPIVLKKAFSQKRINYAGHHLHIQPQIIMANNCSRRSIIRTFRRNSKKIVIFRVSYIKRFYKGLLSQGGQTSVRYIESSYYRGFVLSSVYCIVKYFRVQSKGLLSCS